MLTTIRLLLDQLNGAGIRYCHWKSNWALERTLMGETDIDLLIDRSHARRFRAMLVGLGFEPSIETGVHTLASVEHYHAFDESSGVIVHVHSYYRVISGESIAKNYRLPIEEMLLADPRLEGPIKVPAAGAELIIFVIRMLIKHTTPIELALLMRDRRSVRAEAGLLLTEAACLEAEGLVEQWLPRFRHDLLRECVEALRRPGPLWRRIVLGFRVKAALRVFARRSAPAALATEFSRFAGLALHRLTGSTQKLTPIGGGAVVGFVGSEATGKSTLLAETQRWLGEHYTVTRIHAGKPPSTMLTFIPHTLLPVLRKLAPTQRSTIVEFDHARSEGPPSETFPLLFGIRSVMLAHERRALLTRAFSRSSNGTIVLSDRYPSSKSGAPDSPHLGHLPVPAGKASLRRWLANIEARLYRDIPRPDLIIYLTAPLDVTLARNAARSKTEDETFVRFRHSQSVDLDFEGVQVCKIDTDQPLEATMREIRKAIWDVL
jgi:hypothetical protein